MNFLSRHAKQIARDFDAASCRWEEAKRLLKEVEAEAGLTTTLDDLNAASQIYGRRTEKAHREAVFGVHDEELRKRVITAYLDTMRAFDDHEEAEIGKLEWEAAVSHGQTWANRHFWSAALIGALTVYIGFRFFGVGGACVALAFVFPSQLVSILDGVKRATASAQSQDNVVREFRDGHFKRLVEPMLFDHVEAVTGHPEPETRAAKSAA